MVQNPQVLSKDLSAPRGTEDRDKRKRQKKKQIGKKGKGTKVGEKRQGREKRYLS